MNHAGWRNGDQMAMGYHGREERGLLTSSRAGNGEDGAVSDVRCTRSSRSSVDWGGPSGEGQVSEGGVLAGNAG